MRTALQRRADPKKKPGYPPALALEDQLLFSSTQDFIGFRLLTQNWGWGLQRLRQREMLSAFPGRPSVL
jgi:hypothetical protein